MENPCHRNYESSQLELGLTGEDRQLTVDSTLIYLSLPNIGRQLTSISLLCLSCSIVRVGRRRHLAIRTCLPTIRRRIILRWVVVVRLSDGSQDILLSLVARLNLCYSRRVRGARSRGNLNRSSPHCAISSHSCYHRDDGYRHNEKKRTDAPIAIPSMTPSDNPTRTM